MRGVAGTEVLSRTRRTAVVCVVLIGAAIVAFTLREKPRLQRRLLGDGTLALFRAGTAVTPARGFPNPRTIEVDGELWLEAAAAASPLTVRSRLLVLTVMGAAELHITARSREAGEEVDVISGEVTVRKNFASPYTEPDQLASGEMSLVNQNIDLMEKETFDRTQAEIWRRQFQGP